MNDLFDVVNPSVVQYARSRRDILSFIEDVAKRRQLLFRVHHRSHSLKAESAENGNARNIILHERTRWTFYSAI